VTSAGGRPNWPPDPLVRDDGGVHRPHATLLVAAVLVTAALLFPGTAALAQGESTTTSAVPTRDIIPKPNSGAEPEDAGDRGGALQSVLFVGLIVVVVGGGAWLTVQSRKARADRGF